MLGSDRWRCVCFSTHTLSQPFSFKTTICTVIYIHICGVHTQAEQNVYQVRCQFPNCVQWVSVNTGRQRTGFPCFPWRWKMKSTEQNVLNVFTFACSLRKMPISCSNYKLLWASLFQVQSTLKLYIHILCVTVGQLVETLKFYCKMLWGCHVCDWCQRNPILLSKTVIQYLLNHWVVILKFSGSS